MGVEELAEERAIGRERGKFKGRWMIEDDNGSSTL